MDSDGDMEVIRRGRVLVTGATGFLGGSLVRRLVLDGVRVRALVRSQAKSKELTREGVQVVIGDLHDEGAVDAALDDVAVVYHLAGKLLEPGESPDEYRKTHVDGTKLLIKCCRRHTRLERFVHCSTTGVLGSTGDRPADESAPMRPTNVYESTKADAELAVSAACQEGFPAVIARPGLVYGPGDLHLVGFFRTVLQRRFRPIGAQPVLLHPIYIDDMTDAFVRCGVSDTAVGECFHLAGPEHVSLEQLATAIADAGGTTMPRGRIPLPVARLAAAFGDALPARFRRAAPLTTDRLNFLTHSRVYCVAKAERLLDFRAQTDLPTGIKRSSAWYREHGYLPA
jgi:nucleoside-diphosphate-sugar epimerase